jgi:hypothetical protein
MSDNGQNLEWRGSPSLGASGPAYKVLPGPGFAHDLAMVR